MTNYIHADIRRILGRKSHIFTIVLLFIVYIGAAYLPMRGMQVTSVSLVSSVCGILDWLLPFIGLYELITVFSEDFKVKTMQVAIGLGVSRTQVVVCKLLEVVVLLVLDCIVLLLLTLGLGTLFAVSIPLSVLMDVISTLTVKGILACAAYTSLTMIVLFITQSTILSIFIYFFIAIGLVNIFLTFAPTFGMDWIETLKLNRITLSYLIGAFHSRFVLGSFDVFSFLGILAHIFVGLFATCKLFSKRELDF